MMTKIFFDCEFTGLHQHTTLISIGLVAETGQTFYAEFTDYDEEQINPWLRENILDKLNITIGSGELDHRIIKGNTELIRKYLIDWFDQFERVEMWGDCLAYDWVLFVGLVASYFDGYPKMPYNVYYIPQDLVGLLRQHGIDPDVNRENLAKLVDADNLKHTSLWDAKVGLAIFEMLEKGKRKHEFNR